MREVPGKVWDFLDGKKSFIGAAIIFIAGGLKALGRIDEGLFQALAAIGGSVAAFGLRHAIRKMMK